MDGGELSLYNRMGTRGKRVSPKTEGMVHTIGFMLLMLVFVIISYHDILRIISGQSLDREFS